MATKDAPVNNPMVDPVTGEYRVIAPGHTFKSVTEKVSRIVLTSHTPLGWWFGFLLAGGFVVHAADGGDLAVPEGRGDLGHHDSGGVGLRDHQFRVVDRYRPRGHADLGDSAAVQAELAELD